MEWKNGRQIFEDNYTAVPYESGGRIKISYVYSGPWYFWKTEGKKLCRSKIAAGVLAIVMVVTFVLSGVIKTPISGKAAAEVPALLALVAMLFEIYGAVCFLISGKRMKRPFFLSVRRNILVFSVLQILCASAAAISNLVLACQEEQKTLILWVAALQAACAVSSGAIRAVFCAVGYSSEKNTEFYGIKSADVR